MIKISIPCSHGRCSLMKIVFVQPPIEDFYDTSIRTYPLGLLYLAAGVRDLSDIVLLDARTGFKSKAAEGQPPEGLQGYYRSDRATVFSLFQKYRRFGMSRQALARRIETEQPDIVAISSLFTTYSVEAVEVARIAKNLCPRATTILGGIHPTLFADRVLSDSSVDFVIRGEGETPFRDLIRRLADGKDGKIAEACYKDDDALHIGPINLETKIDRLPDRSLLHAEKYRIGRKKYGALLTSRGCPNHCAFCGKPPVPYRKRSLAGMEEEITDCLDRGIEAIDFQDDMLTGDIPFFRDVLGLLVGRGLTLSAMNGIYSKGLDEATLELMYEAGFRRLNFSLVDASDSLLLRQDRVGITPFVRLLPYLEASPFLVEVHFIVGLPSQTPAQVLETILFLMEKRLLLGPSIFYLAPGSPIFSRAVGEEWQPLVKSLRSSAMVPVNPAFPRPATYTLMKLVRFVNYVKGLLDGEDQLGRISECVEKVGGSRVVEKHVLHTLLSHKKFVWQDTVTGDFVDEPQDKDIIRQFFLMAKGRTIKGFRTNNSLVVDV